MRCRFYTYAHSFSTVISIGFPIFGAHVQFTTSSPNTLLRSTQNTISLKRGADLHHNYLLRIEPTKKHKKTKLFCVLQELIRVSCKEITKREKRNVLHLSDVRGMCCDPKILLYLPIHQRRPQEEEGEETRGPENGFPARTKNLDIYSGNKLQTVNCVRKSSH